MDRSQIPSKQNAIKAKIVKKYVWFHKIAWLFKTFGIDICNSSDTLQKTNSLYIFRIFMKILWGMTFFYGMAELYSSFFIPFKNTKIELLFVPMMIFAFVMWYYMLKLQFKLHKSVSKLQNLADTLNVTCSRQFERVCLLYFTLMYIFRVSKQMYGIKTKISLHFIQKLSFGALDMCSFDWRVATGIRYSFKFIKDHVVYSIPDFVNIFFLMFAYQMTCILNKYVIESRNISKKGRINSKECNRLFENYKIILSTFNAVNEIWSIPILAISSYYSVSIFHESLLIMKKDLNSTRILFTISYVICFTAFIMVSSSVNEMDKIAKKINIKMLCLLGEEDRRCASITVQVLSQVCHGPAFVFSGVSFFELTRSFYLTAVGCLVTYTLLIINIDM